MWTTMICPTPEATAPATDPGVPAMWVALAFVIALAIFEVWALRHHTNTISHWLQRLAKTRRWLRWFGLIGMIVLGWHLFWGFPW